MPELTSKPDSTGGENKKKCIRVKIIEIIFIRFILSDKYLQELKV
jgi:hypothetical protein